MVAMKYPDPLDIASQVGGDLLTNNKQYLKRWGLVILPIIGLHVLQFVSFNTAAADVNSDIFVLMRSLQKLLDRVHRVPVEFFDPASWECHRYDSVCDVG